MLVLEDVKIDVTVGFQECCSLSSAPYFSKTRLAPQSSLPHRPQFSSTPTPAQLISPFPLALCPRREREKEEGEKRGRREGGREGVITGHGLPEGEGEKDKRSVCLTAKQKTIF